MSFERVSVVGAGLIGGSIARRLHEVGVLAGVVDSDPATRSAVAAAGLPVGDVVLAGSDLVMLAGPLDTIGALLTEAATSAPDAVLVDVGSVKTAVHAAVAAAGLAERYVGCHPMGGAELSGFAHSDPALLTDVTWAVTYPDSLGDGWMTRTGAVARFLLEMFDARVVMIDAVEHDASVALVSHGPHVLANALLEVLEAADAPAARHLAAGSVRDATRVAGRNPVRTLNMLADNADALAGVLDRLIAVLTDYRADLDAPRDGALLDRLEQVDRDAAAWRDPDLTWTACTDLDTLLRERGASRAAFLVRAGLDGLESAEA